MTAPGNRAIFRQAALRHYAQRRTAPVVAEVPRPPLAASATILIGLFALIGVGVVHIRVPEYTAGSAIVPRSQPSGTPVLIVAVAPKMRPSLREGQPILIRSPSGEIFVRTQLIRVEPSGDVRVVGSRFGIDLEAELVLGRRAAIAIASWPEEAGARSALNTPGAVYGADIETGRDSLLSHLPIVSRFG